MQPLRAGSLTLTYYSVKPTDYRRTRAPALINTSPWADEGRPVKKSLSKQKEQRQISPKGPAGKQSRAGGLFLLGFFPILSPNYISNSPRPRRDLPANGLAAAGVGCASPCRGMLGRIACANPCPNTGKKPVKCTENYCSQHFHT